MKNLFFITLILFSSVLVYSQNKIMVIDGKSDWVDTGYDFVASNPGFVFASGYVIRNGNSRSFDNYATPSGRSFANWPSNSFPCQTCNATSLIGKVGINGVPFLIGERSYINRTGRLYLRINDTPLWDNRGAFVAVIYRHATQIASNNISRSFEEQIIEEFGEQTSKFINLSSNPDELETNFEIFPNPSRGNVSLEFKNLYEHSKIGKIRVYDLNGTEIFAKDYNRNNGDKILLNTDKLEPNIYLISVEINGEAKNKKLIVQ